MTHPGVGVPTSPGVPPFEHAAQQAIAAARSRVEAFTRPRPPLTPQEREDALKAAEDGGTCRFCASFHPGASTPACPRLATFELNGDGTVIRGSFWPEGVTDAAVELDGEGNVRAVTFHQHSEFDTSQIVRAADAAEVDGGEDNAANGDTRSTPDT
jgi:hypothetical protein